jgi:Highly conserved protein containing a thioredoxin domain
MQHFRYYKKMNPMKKSKGLIAAIAGLLFLSTNFLHAQESSYDELIEPFYQSKTEAFDKAKAEGKYIFLFAGRTTCSSCEASLKAIQSEEIQAIIEESYVLWYIDWDYTKRERYSEGRFYYEAVANNLPPGNLPATYIIDPENPEEILSFNLQRNSIALLTDFLDIEDRPVANETIALPDNKVYISGNTLSISNNNANETIAVYTLTGQQVSSFQKNQAEGTWNAASFPKGVLIIKSSAGWSSKLMNN